MRQEMRRALLGAVIGLSLAGSALAVTPEERLADPAQEARARALGAELRCLVCQNQSIDDSSADLAHDLRVLVREQIKAGKSDQEILDYLQARYGDFVLLKPPVKTATAALWFGPAIVLILGATAIFLYFRRSRTAPDLAPAPLSLDEQQRLAGLLDEQDGSDAALTEHRG